MKKKELESLQTELLQDENEILDTNLVHEFRAEVHESINQASQNHKNMKNVQEQLEQIENVKDEISSWCIDIMNADDSSQEEVLKVSFCLEFL